MFNEESFKKSAKPQMMRCRDGDWEHAKRVVHWVKELAGNDGNLKLFITAGYIHDIGWRDVLPKGKITLEKLRSHEDEANSNSEPYIRNLLSKLNYSESETSTVLELVNAADKHKSSNELEAVIVDADGLSKLDINHLKEKYKKKEWLKMWELWDKEFHNRIKTEKARKLFPDLLEKLKSDIQTNK